MSLFYGYTDDKVTIEQMHTHIHNSLSFTRIWTYDGLSRSFTYPIGTRSGYPSTMMMINNPSEGAKVTIVGIHIDDDGGGLDDSDTLKFEIRYITVAKGSTIQVLNHKVIFIADLSRYTRYIINHGESELHNYTFLHSYNLSKNIPNYRDIKCFNIGVRHSVGVLHGNEIVLVAAFDDK